MSRNDNIDIQALAAENIKTLREGEQLLDSIDQEQFVRSTAPVFHSTIGAHFRHLLEHFVCFFEQHSSGKVLYDSRRRDQSLEESYVCCRAGLQDVIDKLGGFANSQVNQEILVQDSGSTGLVSSTTARELLFLQSHCLHHFAIVGAISRAVGADPAANFGVAISTREHHDSSDQAKGEVSACAQ